jgi:uncharacterized membrane protein YgcG
MRLRQHVFAGLVVVIASAVLVPAAMASSAPSVSLVQSAGTSAGGFHDLGLNLSFSNSGTDTPRNLTLTLPAGLLANADQDNGACLTTPPSASPNAACEVGSGTVTAQPNVEIPGLLGSTLAAPVSVPITFYFVAPPAPGDLAGLEVYTSELNEQLGPTGTVTIRPSGSATGVGATINLSLPDTLTLTLPVLGTVNSAPISVTGIQSTLDNLRYPATCPSTPAAFGVTSTSFDDASPQTVSAPLSVTGCSSLSYSPAYSLSASKDSGDDHVALTTGITQGATQAPSRSIALSFPTSVFSADLDGLGNLCLGAVGSCTAVGSVTADSPLYPTALTGQAYLTGGNGGLSLTLTFPAPFPLTLVGSVSLLTNTASFTGLPDIPLTQLAVKLEGGSRGLFATGCNPASGTSTAKLVDQNGDQSRSITAAVAVSGCPHVTPAGGSPGSGGSGSSGNPGGTSGSGGSGSSGSGSPSGTSATPTVTVSGTHLVADAISGLSTGRPSLRFTVSVHKHVPKLTRLTVILPKGLGFRSRHSGKRTVIRGVALRGAKVQSLRLSHHHLVITLRHSANRARVTLSPAALRESHALRAEAQKRKLKRLRLKVAVRDVEHRTRTLTVTVRRFHLT